MPTGVNGASMPVSVRWRSAWTMRRSISRTLSRYSVNRTLSRAPSCSFRSFALSRTASRMLLFFCSRARRSSGVARSLPNIRSKTTRGLISIGSGCVGEAQLIVLMYEQRKSPAQLPRWLE
jgi:hypothetical protein